MKQKLNFVNKTKWDTKQLKRLCWAVVKHCGSPKSHTIIIETKRGWRYRDYGGLATLNGSWIKMTVPKIKSMENVLVSENLYQAQEVQTIFNVTRFAQILEHEIDHNLTGLCNKDLVHSSEKNVDYVNEFIVEPQQKPKRSIINIKQIRREKAVAKVKELQSKLKRTQTLLKKWQRKVKYYERGSP